ncbi:MAG: GIY-YIG nuclease family protein [Saprospiraceae bacterium]|nr:GIY-YIG nuclease family protein [Saprospiraceae bacterium]
MYAIIDVETTGGAARFERITEIAIVLHDGEKVVDTFSTLINPERSIPPSIIRITGITDDMVARAPKFYEVAKQIVQMTEGAIFVAHNVQFDYSFVKEEFARLGYPFTRRQLCTVKLSRAAFPGLRSYSLSSLKEHFGIKAKRSHRALDDTLATVNVFERILATKDGESMRSFINHGVKATKLPQHITLERLHEVPEACGVYYLHDDQGKVIYVGKSLNIRKRLFEHFADLTPKGEKLRQGVEDLSWEITGSELVALLLESAEIKRLQPRVNRAQRKQKFDGGIFTYTDDNGYKRLIVGKNTLKNAQKLQLVSEYPKLDNAKLHLQATVRQHELCYRLSHLDLSEHACFHYGIRQCHGACIGAETPDDYNLRVEAAISGMSKRLQGNFFLFDRGRTDDEAAIVGVQDGRYLGYGFIDIQTSNPLIEDLLESLTPPGIADPDATRIISLFASGKKGVKMVSY